jgi:hypothetical protein
MFIITQLGPNLLHQFYVAKTSMLPTSTYPVWCNVILFFVLLDPKLYPTYLIQTKRLYTSNYTCYVPTYVYPIPKHPIVPPTFTPYSIGN